MRRITCRPSRPQPLSLSETLSGWRKIGRCCCSMRDLFRLIGWAVVDLLRLRAALEAEIWTLRQQINVLRRTGPKRLSFSVFDRLVFVGLYRLFPKICDALAIAHGVCASWLIPRHRSENRTRAVDQIGQSGRSQGGSGSGHVLGVGLILTRQEDWVLSGADRRRVGELLREIRALLSPDGGVRDLRLSLADADTR